MKQISFIALAAILAVTYVAAFPLDENELGFDTQMVKSSENERDIEKRTSCLWKICNVGWSSAIVNKNQPQHQELKERLEKCLRQDNFFGCLVAGKRFNRMKQL